MNIKVKWQHIFLCLIFGHKNYYYKEEIEDQFGYHLWKICKRCAEAERLPPPPPEHPNCLCISIPGPSKKELEFIEFREICNNEMIGNKLDKGESNDNKNKHL